VPDAACYELMRRFYRQRTASGSDSEALRTAQLDTLRALRTGTMKVAAPGGDLALPEHPLFWAGLVLVGEP
jgi:CHAT domain-containing protein